jgi:hypothetical protein
MLVVLLSASKANDQALISTTSIKKTEKLSITTVIPHVIKWHCALTHSHPSLSAKWPTC